MPEGFKSLHEVFRKEQAFGKLRETVKAAEIINDFSKIFPDLKKLVTAHSVDKKVLKLKVENPAWRSELKFREVEIIDLINKFYKEERITQIRFIG